MRKWTGEIYFSESGSSILKSSGRLFFFLIVNDVITEKCPSAKLILTVSLNVRIQGGGSWAM